MTTKNSYWINSGVYSLGSRFSTLLFGFGSFYFLIRSLPKEQFGVWALFLTITTIVETSRNGLVQNALIKLLFSHSSEDAHKVVSASWFINGFYSLIIYGILVFSSAFVGQAFDSPAIQTMFILYGITLFLLIPFSQFNFLQQAKFSFSGIFWSTLTRQGIFFLAICVIYLLDYPITLVNLVLLQAICTFLGLIVAYFCAKKYTQYKFELDWIITKKVFHFGKYVMGTNISSLVFKSTDQLMLGSFLGPAPVALYNSAVRLSNLIEYPASSVAEIVYPKSAAKFEESGESSSKLFFEKSVGLTMTLTLPTILGTFLLADYIIYFIAGPEYAQAAEILRVTILFGLFAPFSRQFGTAMDSSGRPHLNFLVLIMSVFINVICNFIGIKAYGLMGAAYGTLLAYFIVNLISYSMMVKIFKVEMGKVFGYMFEYYGLGFKQAKKMILKR